MGVDTEIRTPLQKISAEQATDVMARAEDMDLRRLVATVWRSRWLLSIFAVLGLCIALVHLQRVVPLYTAQAKVLWDAAESNIVDIDPVISGSMSRDYRMLESQIEIVESSHLLGKVADRINTETSMAFNPALRPQEGWTRYLSVGALIGGVRSMIRDASGDEAPAPAPVSDSKQRERLISQLRAMVRADWVERSYVMRITATTADPITSAELSNLVAEFFILDQLEKKFEATQTATEWLTARVGELRVDLESAERAVKAYSASSDTVSPESLEANARRMKDMRSRLQELGERMQSIKMDARLANAAFASGDYNTVAELLNDPEITRLASQVETAERAGEVPELQIGRIEAALRRAERSAEENATRIAGQREALSTTIGQIEEELDRQSKALIELGQLQREAEASRLIYESFLSRLKETSVQLGIQQPDARLLSEAWVPGGPSSPNRPAILAMGVVGGLMLAVFVVIIRERMNASFRTADDLESRTGHAVLGTVPLAPIPRRSALMDYLLKRPASSFAESVRNLRTSILLANVDKPPQVIMLCSGLPGEGKTTCCISLAQISRSLGRRVLLIECDLRRRNFRKYFKIESKGGLLSVLSGHKPYDEVVHVDEGSGLHVLPGEESSVNAADVFSSRRFSEFIAELRQHYDYIFIDTPPVLAVPDARVISQSVDSVIYLVRWNRTLRESVAQGLRFFQQVNVRVAGLCLTQIDVREMARYGYKAYGYYRQAERYYQK